MFSKIAVTFDWYDLQTFYTSKKPQTSIFDIDYNSIASFLEKVS